MGPHLVEVQPRLPQEVDPVRGHAELQNLVGVVGVEEMRAAELGQGSIGARDVPCIQVQLYMNWTEAWQGLSAVTRTQWAE